MKTLFRVSLIYLRFNILKDKMVRTWSMGNNSNNICWRRQRRVSQVLNLTGISSLIDDPVKDLSDLALVNQLSGGRVDLTYGRQVVVSQRLAH
jgi:hypothetical protein